MSPDLVSSNNPFYTEQKAFGGIFNPSPELNPDFYNWTHVYLMYTSSDVWSGDRKASAETGDFYFRGKRILTAVLEDLMDPTLIHGPNLSLATEVLFGGVSAGAQGVKQNIDLVAQILSPVPVRGIDDSNFFPLPTDPAALEYFYKSKKELAEFWYAQLNVHPSGSA